MNPLISFDDYFGQWGNHPDATDDKKDAARTMLDKVNDLLEKAFADGVDFTINPRTKSYVSGAEFGGFRPRSCPEGAPDSAHKWARAVDVYDPLGVIDRWCITHQPELQRRGLYMEAPSATLGWCHLTDRAPHSGKIVFNP